MTYEKKTNTISVGPGSDFIADSGIFWIHTLKKLSVESSASLDLKTDWEVVERWLRCEGRELSQADEERVGKAWRAYMAIGLAPSFALQPTFDFISKQYERSIESRSSDKPPTEIMDVFDRLLATNEEILAKRAYDIDSEKKKFQKIFASKMKHKSLRERLTPLSRVSRISIIFSLSWAVWVIFRTSGYYELFGHSFERWNDDMFLANLLLPPIAIFLIFAAYRWVTKASH